LLRLVRSARRPGGRLRCRGALRRCARRREHAARSGLVCQILERDRLLLLPYGLFLVGPCYTILGPPARLRIGRRSDLGRSGGVRRDDRRRLRCAGTGVIGAERIGAGGTEHGAPDERERGGEAAAAPSARWVVIHRVLVRIERDVLVVV